MNWLLKKLLGVIGSIGARGALESAWKAAQQRQQDEMFTPSRCGYTKEEAWRQIRQNQLSEHFKEMVALERQRLIDAQLRQFKPTDAQKAQMSEGMVNAIPPSDEIVIEAKVEK